jgi:hypothetical protein
MKKLAPSVIKQVQKLLPEVREITKQEFPKWHEYTAGDNFYADEKVIEHLPSSWYEYAIILKKIHTDREFAFYCLHHLTDENMSEVLAHTLKRLALIDSYISENLKDKMPGKRILKKKDIKTELAKN